MYWRVLTVILLLSGRPVFGQAVITGTVYDHSQKFTMTGVSVLSTTGAGTTTDSTGHYRLRVGAEDSIYFSYLGKSTLRFPAKEINANQPFDMALEVSIDSLPAAFVRGNNYFLDSLQTRRDYAKVFDYNKSYLSSVKRSGRGGMGVGFDLDLLFNSQENRRMEAFKDRLEWQEKENFVDHRFTKAIVHRVTGLEPPALDTFMKLYRPSQEFIQSCETTYEYYKYIRQWCGYFVDDWNLRHPDMPPRSKEWVDSVTLPDDHR